MALQNETGHARNIANLERMIAFCESYGAAYSPSRPSLKIPALKALRSSATDAMHTVAVKNTDFNNAINTRSEAFESIKSLSQRMLSGLIATDATDAMLGDAKGINRKIQGQRASSTVATPEPLPGSANTALPAAESAKSISSSQQSFDQKMEHLFRFITILKSEPSYTPAEPELKIATLDAYYASLAAANTAVANALATVSASRIARDKIMYQPGTGINDVAHDAKNYIKSAFSASASEYTQVRTLKFTTPR